MTTGEKIKAARKKAGLTQNELATKLNVPFQSISQWERDIRNPKTETLKKIAEALAVSPIEIMSNDLRGAFFEGYNSLLRNKRYYAASTVEEAEDAEEDVLLLLSYFDELDLKRQKEAVAFVRSLTGAPSIIGVLPAGAAEMIFTELNKLNDEGQQKAVERVAELTEIPKYQK